MEEEEGGSQEVFVELEDAIHKAERTQVRIWLRFLESSFPTCKEIFMAMPKSSTLAWQWVSIN